MTRYLSGLLFWIRLQNDKWLVRRMEEYESFRSEWSRTDLRNYENLRHKYFVENDDIRIWYKKGSS